MPFNGSGTFTRVMNWVNDAAANIKIRADRHDQEDDNLASGLSQCITKDGQTTITANLPMATYRHTGVGAAAVITDYARYDQLQLGKAVWADAGGTVDAITASYGVTTTSPVDGQMYFVRAAGANTSSTPTFSPDGNTARTVVKFGNQALVAGDIAADGHELILRYRLSDTKYELLNPSSFKNVLGAKGTAIASATTTDIGAADSDFIDVTGATTITGLGATATRNHIWVNFTGILTLTHNATSLILPGGTSITTAAGDIAEFIRVSGSNWKCASYIRANGSALAYIDGTISYPKLTTSAVASAAEILAGTASKLVNAANIKNLIPTTWEPFTPTFTGFGTATSITGRRRRVGSNLEIEIKCTSGTATATEARISFGDGSGAGAGAVSANDYTTTEICGFLATSNALGTYLIHPLIEASVGYLTFGATNTNGLTKQNANGIISGTDTWSVRASVRIQGW